MDSYMKKISAVWIGNHTEEKMVSVVKEHRAVITVNDAPTFQLVCSPGQIKELILGYLFTQGYLTALEQITRLDINTVENQTFVNVEGDFHITGILSVATTGAVGQEGAALGCKSIHKWEPEWIFQLAKLFSSETELYQKTHGAHSCMLAHEGRCLYFSEDIGRHNALDKVIGQGLLNREELSEMILYSSGRIPEDMMRKVIRSTVPVIVTNSVPTDEAISLAQQYGITLIGNARPSGMILYTA